MPQNSKEFCTRLYNSNSFGHAPGLSNYGPTIAKQNPRSNYEMYYIHAGKWPN